MSATIYPGVSSIVLDVLRPYEEDGVTPRDDFIGMKVWVSQTSGFNPLDANGAIVMPPAYDGSGTNCVIANLIPGTMYFVRYALISQIDPAYIGLSPELSTSPISEVAGEAAETFWLIKNTSVITRSPEGALSPATVMVSSRYKIGSEEPTPYLGRFVVSATADGTSYIDLYTSSVDEASCSADIPPLMKSVRIRLYGEGGTVAQLDEESIPVVAEPFNYDVRIESTNGTEFRVGQSTVTLLIARVFRNGVDVTDQIPESRFQWKRVSLFDQPYPNDDNSWNTTYQAGYKQVQVNIDNVSSRATFHCYIVE